MGNAQRFDVGTQVHIKSPWMSAIVKHVGDKIGSNEEYWYELLTRFGERKEPECNLELNSDVASYLLSPKAEEGESILRKHWLYFVSGAVALVGALGLYFCADQGPLHSVLEAVVIAALLAFSVDPFVKRTLVEEANKDIFYRVIGFSLPQAMQDRLNKYLRGLKYYRKSLSIRVELAPGDDGVEIKIIETAVVKALTDCDFTQKLEFEEVERGKVSAMYVEGAERPKISSFEVVSPSDQMTVCYAGSTLKMRRDEELTSHFAYSLRGRKTDVWAHIFGTTTLETVVTIVPREDTEILVSPIVEPRKNGDLLEYHYGNVFVIGENIRIRWRMKQ